MAEMIGLSRDVGHRTGAIGGLVAALKRAVSRLTGGGRSTSLRPEEWPDYLLRDIGLDSRISDEVDPRGRPTDWLMR
jgi:hypothetical protein